MEEELHNRWLFVSLVLGCGVHAKREGLQPVDPELINIMAKLRQMADSWSVSANHARKLLQLHRSEMESPLSQLRGDVNTGPRQLIASYMGVRVGFELRRCRDAKRALEEALPRRSLSRSSSVASDPGGQPGLTRQASGGSQRSSTFSTVSF